MVLIGSMKIYLFIIFLVGFSYSSSVQGESEKNEKKSIPAYDFTLQILNDGNDSLFTLSSLKGNVILINFWATWCGPCIAEIPEFNDLREKYSSKNFEILGISVNDTKEQLQKFTSKIDVDYPILYGHSAYLDINPKKEMPSKEELEELKEEFGENMSVVIANYGGFYSVPVSYLVNRDGQIVAGYPSAIIGEYWTNLLENDIKTFLADPPSPNKYDHHQHQHKYDHRQH